MDTVICHRIKEKLWLDSMEIRTNDILVHIDVFSLFLGRWTIGPDFRMEAFRNSVFRTSSGIMRVIRIFGPFSQEHFFNKLIKHEVSEVVVARQIDSR